MENGNVVEEANGEQGQLLMRQAETGSVEWLEGGSESVSQPNQADHFNARETPVGAKYSRLGFLCLLVSRLPQGLG